MKNAEDRKCLKKEINLSQLTQAVVADLIESSIQDSHQEMDTNTICLVDISRFKLAGCNTLIIQQCGLIVASSEKSNQLLEAYSKVHHASHDETMLIAKTLGYQQKVPYIIGDQAIIPSEGYSKKNVSWLVLNKVRNYKSSFKGKLIHVYSHQHLLIKIPMALTVFENQLERAAHLIQTKRNLHRKVFVQYNMHLKELEQLPDNILSDTMYYENFYCPPLSAQETVMSIIKRKMLHISNMIFEEGDPYHDDFKDALNKYLPFT